MEILATTLIRKETMDRKESRPHNSTYPKGGVSCSAVRQLAEVNQTLVLRMKFCGENRQLLVAAKRQAVKKLCFFSKKTNFQPRILLFKAL